MKSLLSTIPRYCFGNNSFNFSFRHFTKAYSTIEKEKELFLLIDGTSIFYKARFVSENLLKSNIHNKIPSDSQELHKNKQVSATGVYRFPQSKLSNVDQSTLHIVILSLAKLIRRFQPTYFLLTFDTTSSRQARSTVWSDYKQKRPPKFSKNEIKIILNFCKLANLPTYQATQYEADDVIASVARRILPHHFYDLNWDLSSLLSIENNTQSITLNKQNWVHEVDHQNDSKALISLVIVSPDKDLCQLIRNDDASPISVVRPNGNASGETGRLQPNIPIWDESSVFEKWAVNPSQLPVLFALHGDISDGIPGVSGVGEVTASKLIKESSSLCDLFSRISESQRAQFTRSLELKSLYDVSQALDACDRPTVIRNNITAYKLHRGIPPELSQYLCDVGLNQSLLTWKTSLNFLNHKNTSSKKQFRRDGHRTSTSPYKQFQKDFRRKSTSPKKQFQKDLRRRSNSPKKQFQKDLRRNSNVLIPQKIRKDYVFLSKET